MLVLGLRRRNQLVEITCSLPASVAVFSILPSGSRRCANVYRFTIVFRPTRLLSIASILSSFAGRPILWWFPIRSAAIPTHSQSCLLITHPCRHPCHSSGHSYRPAPSDLPERLERLWRTGARCPYGLDGTGRQRLYSGVPNLLILPRWTLGAPQNVSWDVYSAPSYSRSPADFLGLLGQNENTTRVTQASFSTGVLSEKCRASFCSAVLDFCSRST
ncbi:hypothetical protein OBBRIDRAFT_421230 [Obba rivulosa]|uniref:Uncharacterized protein n=1 Tax=Obba rivulosa TaxID=1052685 RepID=A0A8E2APA2_9APHY|nr:hypothetical protein OBBRIDRAFT_421230 [Obba rivulosa]